MAEPASRIGRPPIGPEVKTRLDETDISDLERRAGQLGCDRSELIRRYVRAGLKHDARRYGEASSDDATHTLELYRGESPCAVGEDLAEWLSDHSLDDAAWQWLEDSDLSRDDPDVWGLVCPIGDGHDQHPVALLPIAPKVGLVNWRDADVAAAVS